MTWDICATAKRLVLLNLPHTHLNRHFLRATTSYHYTFSDYNTKMTIISLRLLHSIMHKMSPTTTSTETNNEHIKKWVCHIHMGLANGLGLGSCSYWTWLKKWKAVKRDDKTTDDVSWEMSCLDQKKKKKGYRLKERLCIIWQSL